MGPTLQVVLDQPGLHLRLVAGAEPGDGRLSAPLTGAHSSELEDPTPWLSPGGLLLTDGSQLERDGPGRVEDYVSRLAACGVAALGFATHVVHDELPGGLVEACARSGLPLLEVAERTPFVAITSFVNDAAIRSQRQRLEWSLAAQREVARAGLRPDGLDAVLRELERQLGCWVALFDAGGRRVPSTTTLPIPEASVVEVADAVRSALARGARAGARISSPGRGTTLQALGRHRGLRGVLAVGTATPPDPAGHDPVTSVIDLASIALEQSRTLEDARRHLRSGLLQLMLSGASPLAEGTARQLWRGLPAAPVRVSVVADDQPARTLPAVLELYAERHPGRLFFAEHEERLVVVTRHDDTGDLAKILQQNQVGAGSSTPVSWTDLSTGLAEARRSATRAGAGRRFVRFEELASEGMLGMLEASGGGALALRLLLPLETRPAPERDVLVRTARTWLEHKGAWDPAAKQLGVHRHTLRNRIATLEDLLGLDLERFADRVELWAALQLRPSG